MTRRAVAVSIGVFEILGRVVGEVSISRNSILSVCRLEMLGS